MANATAGMMGAITMRVTPEMLYEKAEQVKSRIGQVQGSFDEIAAAVNGSAGYWVGSAGELHRKIYRDSREEINNRLQRFLEAAEILSDMAAVYQQGESDALQKAQTLSPDVIV